MLVDLSPKYKPDPTYVEGQEGDDLMKFWADTVNFQKRIPGSKAVNIGWNWSPRHLSLEQRGFQSLLTKWHPQFWNFEDLTNLVPLSSLDEVTRRGIEGNKFNELFGRLVLASIHNPIFFGTRVSDFIDLNGRADARGIEFTLKNGLAETFQSHKFYEDFLERFAKYLGNMALDFTHATTAIESERDEGLLKMEFETGTNGVFDILQEPPRLLSLSERRQRISNLLGKYEPSFARRLMLLSPHLQEREVVPKTLWFRKGFAYALVFSEDLESGKSIMRIMPGVFAEDRGGVVEALGIALTRKTEVDGSELFANNKKRNLLRKFGEDLHLLPLG